MSAAGLGFPDNLMGMFGYKREEECMSKTDDSMVKADNVRKFESGAIRDVEDGKEDFIETISWVAFRRYAQYMTSKKSKYGSGNFKKSIPIDSYERSLMRHVSKYLINKYENGNLEKQEDHLAAIVFNAFGIMHEEEVRKNAKND